MTETAADKEQIATDRLARRATRMRWILGGPGAFVLSILLMATLPLVLPLGVGGVNHIVMPVILFPLLWASLTIVPVWAPTIGLTAKIYGASFVMCCGLIVYALV